MKLNYSHLLRQINAIVFNKIVKLTILNLVHFHWSYHNTWYIASKWFFTLLLFIHLLRTHFKIRSPSSPNISFFIFLLLFSFEINIRILNFFRFLVFFLFLIGGFFQSSVKFLIYVNVVVVWGSKWEILIL